jgi:phosphatidylglycerol:prolipoprotein diacylglycerol transferase
MWPILFSLSWPQTPLWLYLSWISLSLLGGRGCFGLLRRRLSPRGAALGVALLLAAFSAGCVALLFALLPVETVAVSSYGAALGLACLVGGGLSLWRISRAGLFREALGPLLAASLATGFLGAHLAKILSQPEPGALWTLSAGGGVWVAGLLAGGMFGVGSARRLGMPLGALVDALVPGLFVGLALGRLGCLLHGCDFGAPTDSFLALTYPAEVFDPAAGAFIESPASIFQHSQTFADRFPAWVAWLAAYDDRSQGAPLSLPVHPWPVYEAVFALCLCGFSLFLARRAPRGRAALVTLSLYALGRFWLDFWRGDEQALLAGFTLSQWLCALLLLVGVAALRLSRR